MCNNVEGSVDFAEHECIKESVYIDVPLTELDFSAANSEKAES